jgi:Pretoxin HINT domain
MATDTSGPAFPSIGTIVRVTGAVAISASPLDNLIDAIECVRSLNEGDLTDSAINCGAAVLPGVIGSGLDAAQAARRGARIADDVRDAERAAEAAKDAERASDAAKCTHSFTSDTPVAMAKGTHKPIADVVIGDQVLATDPATGEPKVRAVTALHRHLDTELADITVVDANGAESTIKTTDGHQIWSETDNRWEPAGTLSKGEQLASLHGPGPQVVNIDQFQGVQVMYDLTIATTHTYYVATGNTTTLVHNTGCEDLLGTAGTQVTSKTLLDNGTYHIDVENPAPGVRAGQLHLQYGDEKYLYDFGSSSWIGMPKWLEEIVNKDPKVPKAITKGATYLGVEP